MLFGIFSILTLFYTCLTFSEYGPRGFIKPEFAKVITTFFTPLVIKIFSSLLFAGKGKKILKVFSTLMNEHRIIDIEYPDISDQELLNVIETYRQFYSSKIEVLPIEGGYMILGKMNLWKKIIGENDDFYIEQTTSGFKIYLNTVGGKSPVYKFCEYHFGMR